MMAIRRLQADKHPGDFNPTAGDLRKRSGVWALVITQNPGADFLQNLLTYKSQVDRVLIVDSGSSISSLNALRAVLDKQVELVEDTSGLGIAGALNRGFVLAGEAGAEWAIAFDQDSSVMPGYVRGLLQTLNDVSFANQVALISPADQPGSLGVSPDPIYREIKSSFTSGTLLRLDAIERAGLLEERLFADYVDHEFCLRLASHGYRLVETRRVSCAGQIMRRQISLSAQGTIRQYYMSRNRLIVYRRFFFVDPLWVLSDLANLVLELLRTVFFEEQKWQKFISIARGLAHGARFSMTALAPLEIARGNNRIGIVLATYRPPLDYLREQLQSIRAQSDINWHCVLTDDGSDELLRAQIHSLATEVFGVDSAKWSFRVNGERLGVVSNFAEGLKALPLDCSLVCFCDQDDLWAPDKLAVLRREFDDPAVALAHSDLRLVDAKGLELHPSCWSFEGRDVRRTDIASLILRNSVSGCAMMFRRDVLNFCLPFPEQPFGKPWFYHDVWIALGASLYGRVRAVPNVLINYRQHGNNVVGAEAGFLGARRSGWSIEKAKAAWRSRAALENAFHRRVSERADQLHENRAHRVFSVPWDFGSLAFLLAFRVAFRSPRYIKVAVSIATGKFFADVTKLMICLGKKSPRPSESP